MSLACVFGAWRAAGQRRRATAAGVTRLPVVTEPMADVVRQIDANNGQLPTLWARHYYEVNLVDDKKQSHFVNGDGVLMYRRPMGMRLVGTKPFAGTVFEIGSTEEKYWLKLVPEVNTMWYGDYANLGKPCVQPVPIQPNMVFEVLGVGTFNTDFTAAPAPVMRYNPDADAYMFVWIVPASDPPRFVAQKEIWYDRKTKLPRLVLLFDADGRVVLRAYLAKHRQVEVADQPKEKWPSVATDYRLYFPGQRLEDVVHAQRHGAVQEGRPLPQGHRLPRPTPDEAGVERVIQLDEGCGRNNRNPNESEAPLARRTPSLSPAGRACVVGGTLRRHGVGWPSTGRRRPVRPPPPGGRPAPDLLAHGSQDRHDGVDCSGWPGWRPTRTPRRRRRTSPPTVVTHFYAMRAGGAWQEWGEGCRCGPSHWPAGGRNWPPCWRTAPGS